MFRVTLRAQAVAGIKRQIQHKSPLYSQTPVQDRAVTDPPQLCWGWTWLEHSWFDSGAGRTSLQVATGEVLLQDGRTSFLLFASLGETLKRYSRLPSISWFKSILYFQPEMVNYGYLMFTTYPPEQFFLFCYFSKLKAFALLQENTFFFSQSRATLLSHIIVLYVWLNISVLFA